MHTRHSVQGGNALSQTLAFCRHARRNRNLWVVVSRQTPNVRSLTNMCQLSKSNPICRYTDRSHRTAQTRVRIIDTLTTFGFVQTRMHVTSMHTHWHTLCKVVGTPQGLRNACCGRMRNQRLPSLNPLRMAQVEQFGCNCRGHCSLSRTGWRFGANRMHTNARTHTLSLDDATAVVCHATRTIVNRTQHRTYRTRLCVRLSKNRTARNSTDDDDDGTAKHRYTLPICGLCAFRNNTTRNQQRPRSRRSCMLVPAARMYIHVRC